MRHVALWCPDFPHLPLARKLRPSGERRQQAESLEVKFQAKATVKVCFCDWSKYPRHSTHIDEIIVTTGNFIKYFFAAITIFALSQTIYADKITKKLLQVFILAGQSNMQGQGMVTAQDDQGHERPGTLLVTLKDRTKARQLKHLVNAKGEWAEKRDRCVGL